jgi:hypothetical protein
MRMLVTGAVVLLSLCFSAHAQQPDLSKIVPIIEFQRNQALTNHALAEAKVAELTEENTKLKAEIVELKQKLGEKDAK